jgi:hypothetical protein
MIQTYIDKLIDNLPEDIKHSENIKHLDIILDGGLFNGSYLIGALYFLREMEKRQYIKIDKISGCSIGSISAFLYLIDQLDMVNEIYEIISKDLRENHHVNKIKEVGIILNEKIPNDICDKINGKLYITYYHVQKRKKIIKSQYKNKKDVVDTIIRSCFVPFFIDGNILYREKYIDGLTPYIFPFSSNKDIKNNLKKKTLFLDLFGYDKITHVLNVKNEKTNFHRVLTGLLDIHNFFIKQSCTQMCSYVEDWSITNCLHNQVKVGIEKMVILFIYLLVFIKKYISKEMESTILYRFLSKVAYELYILLLETYSL